MTTEPFAAGDSWMHRSDPRLRCAFAAAFSVPVSVASDFPVILVGLVISILLIALARLNPLAVARRLAVALGFLIFLWLVVPTTYEGTPVWRMGPVSASREGMILSAQITIKSVAILSALTALLATMGIADLGQALAGLGIPAKMVQLLLLTYRYIFVIEGEYLRLIRAARVRRFRPGTNLHTYKTYAYLIGMLFVRAAYRAERVHLAMKCRGFHGRFYSLKDFPSGGRMAFAVLMAGCLAALGGVQWMCGF